MKNPYTAKLEAELADIIRRRVALRNVLKAASYGLGTGDAWDRRQTVETAARELKFLEREYQRLHHELGWPLPHPGSVRIGAPPVGSTGAVRYPAPHARRVRTLPNYVTKIMRAD